MPIVIGREAVTAELLSALRDSRATVVTVAGRPGVGKSALVRHVGLELEELGHSWRLVDATTARSVIDLRRLLRTRRAAGSESSRMPQVLVLDGCDGVHETSELQRLVDQVPDSRYLLTSARPLGLRGERVIWLGPLETRTRARNGASSASRLLLTRAEERDAHFDPASLEPAQVQALCDLVEGYPLGLEILASRLSMHHPQLLSSRLERALAGRRTVPRWPAQLHTVLELLEQDVHPAAAVALRRMAIWDGPIPLNLSLESGPEPHQDLSDLPDLIEVLVNAHCLEPVHQARTPAYRMPRAVREHLLTRLESLGEVEVAEDYRAEAVSSFVGARAGALLAGDTGAHDEVQLIEADLSGALDHLTSRGPVSQGLQLALDLAPVISRRGYDGLMSHHLRNMLAHAQHDVVPDTLLALGLSLRAQSSLIFDPQVRPKREASTLNRTVELARSTGDATILVRCLLAVVQAWPITGDHRAATRAAVEAEELAPRLTPRWRGLALGWAGMVWAQLGEGERAAVLYERSVETLREVTDAELRFVCVMLGSLLPEPLPLAGAPEIRDVIEEARARGDLHQESILLKVAAGLALRTGDQGLAAQRCLESLAVPRSDFWRSELYTVTYLVLIAVQRQDMERGAQFHGMVQRHLDVVQLSLPPALAELYELAVGGIRQALGDKTFTEVADQGAWLGSDAAVPLVTAYAREAAGGGPQPPFPRNPTPGVVPLTPRELQVLDVLVTGATNKEIGETLGLSAKSVMHHATRIYQKLGVRGRAEAVAWAVRQHRT